MESWSDSLRSCGSRYGRASFLASATLALILDVALIRVGPRRLGRAGGLLLGFGAGYAALFALGNPLMLGWSPVPLERVLASLLSCAASAIRSSRVRYA